MGPAGTGFAYLLVMGKRRLQGLIFAIIFLVSTPDYAHLSSVRNVKRSPAASIHILEKLTEDLLSKAEVPMFSQERSSEWLGDFERLDALRDPAHRISPDFRVPKILKKRTQFWYDIYTKYGETHHVIHHTRYPWIVYKVVDTSDIYANKKLHKWTKYHRAKKVVAIERNKIRRALKRLAKKRSYKKLKGLEKDLYGKLAVLRGKRRHVFRKASTALRSQLGQKDFFLAGLKNSARYLPYMEEEFREAGLPVELTRIPFVESSFNVHAQSKVGASGIWQIMPRVGKSYFIVNKYIDERNSPLKASFVALDLMKRNYKSLKQWPLAVTAYNHGAYGVKKAMRRSKSKNLSQLITRYHKGSFKFASSNFYTSFLAVLHAERYHREIFEQERRLEKADPIRYSVYQLNKRMRAKNLMKLINVDKKTFVTYNLDLKNAVKRNAWVPKGFRLLVPLEKRIEIDAKSPSSLRPIREARAGKVTNLRGS